MPQFHIKVKDLDNSTTSVVSVYVLDPIDANSAAIKAARILLGHDNVEVVGTHRFKPVA